MFVKVLALTGHTALNCVQQLFCHGLVSSSRLNHNSLTYLQMHTSSLPYLPDICEDFLLLEKKSMFIFQLFICEIGNIYSQVTKSNDDVITHVHSWSDARVFVFIFTSKGFQQAQLGTNSPNINVAYVAHAKIDAKYIAANCSCILLKFRSNMSHINSRITGM